MNDEWKDIAPAEKAAPSQEPVRFALQKMRGGPARAAVLIRRDVIAQTGAEHWRVRVVMGSGAERRHQIAIVSDAEGPFELLEVGKTKGGGTFRVLLPHVADWPDLVVKAMARPYKIGRVRGKPAIIVDLPAFCFDQRAREAFEQRAQSA